MNALARLLVVLAVSLPLLGQSADREQIERYLRAGGLRPAAEQRTIAPDSCAAVGRFTDGIIQCGQSVQGEVGGTGDCVSQDGYFLDLWEAPATAGQDVTVTFTGNRPNDTAFLVILRDVGTLLEIARSTGRGTLQTHFAAPATDTYLVAVGYSAAQLSGTYTLSMTCFGSGPPPGSCVPDPTTVCLLQNRFEVRARYRGAFDNQPADTPAQVKSVIGFSDPNYETAFFYFNSSNNIEMMVKMLDQGNVDAQGHPTIALLYGTATPLRIELTVRDSKAGGTTRTWTSAFGKMEGATDFNAFVK